MNYLKKLNFLVLVISILLPIFFLSCASEQEVITEDIVEKKLYDQAQRQLKTKNYMSAILSLETLEKRFPFGKYAQQAQIELVYAHYKSNNYELAVIAAERFISLHPRHPNIDYVFYIKGLEKAGMGVSGMIFFLTPTCQFLLGYFLLSFSEKLL